MSRWSASTLVTTATVGVSARKDRSYSSASTTWTAKPPGRRLPPQAPTRPPATPVGSRPAAASASVVITVVVVLPCVPAIATSSPPLTASASASARRITGMPSDRARSTSGWSRGSADVTTSARAPATCAGSWPVATEIPKRPRSPVASPVASHPVTDRAAANEELGKRTHPSAGNAHEVNGSAVRGVDERHELARRI